MLAQTETYLTRSELVTWTVGVSVVVFVIVFLGYKFFTRFGRKELSKTKLTVSKLTEEDIAQLRAEEERRTSQKRKP